MAAVYFFLKDDNGRTFAIARSVALGSVFCQIRIVKIVQHIRRPGHVGALLHGAVGAAVSACVPVGDVLHGVRVHQGAVAHLLEARQLQHGAAHPVAGLGHHIRFQLLACPHPVNVLRQPRVNAVLVLLNAGVLGRCMYRRVIVHSCLVHTAASLCRKARHLAPRSASSVQLRAARHASGSPLWGSCRRSRLRGLIPGQRSISGGIRSRLVNNGGCRRCGLRCPIQRFAHTVQSRAHSAAQRARSAAGESAFQRGEEGVFGKQVLRRLAVPQRSVDGHVGIGLRECLHRVVDAARDGRSHRRIALRQLRAARQPLHPVRDLPCQCVLRVVRAHGLCKVCCAHRVDGPSCAELGEAAAQCLTGALALLRALAHGLCCALGAQHRQDPRNAVAACRNGQVLRRAGHGPRYGPLGRAQAALGRSRQLLAPVVELVAHALVLVDAVAHFQPRQLLAHLPDLLGVVPHRDELPVPALRPCGVIVHVHVGQKVKKALGVFVALYLLLHLFPVLQGGVDVLSRLYAVLRAQHRSSGHRVSDAAGGVRRPARKPLPCGDGVQRSVHLPGLVDLCLCPAALLDEVGVRVDARVVHPAHRVGQILVVPGAQPLVDPVELVRYAVLGKAGSQLLRPAAAVGHGPAVHVLQHVPALRRYAPLLPHVQRPFSGASFKKGALRPGCGSQRLLRCRLHPAGRCPNSSSLFRPLAAVVAVAPIRGAPFSRGVSRRER